MAEDCLIPPSPQTKGFCPLLKSLLSYKYRVVSPHQPYRAGACPALRSPLSGTTWPQDLSELPTAEVWSPTARGALPFSTNETKDDSLLKTLQMERSQLKENKEQANFHCTASRRNLFHYCCSECKSTNKNPQGGFSKRRCVGGCSLLLLQNHSIPTWGKNRSETKSEGLALSNHCFCKI